MIKWVRFALVGLMLAACGGRTGEINPPEIQYGQEMCSACGMIISEARFAAATILEDGTALKFDDIGEMLRYHQNHPELQVKAWFVHDYESETWIRAETAYFVRSNELKTPMGSGVAAFESLEVAEAFVSQRHGEIFSLEELRGVVPEHGHTP